MSRNLYCNTQASVGQGVGEVLVWV